MIKLGTVGTSKIAEHFVAAAHKTGRFKLSCVYSRAGATGKAFADKFRCESVVTEIESLADSCVDAVYVASPNVFHYEQCKELLRAGKHVICEKSVTVNHRQFLSLKQIAGEKNLIFMEAIMSAHSVSRNALKSAVSGIGNIALARIDFCRKSSRYDSLLRGEKVNIFDMSLHAGALMDMGVYCVYAAVDLFGMPKKISACASFLGNGADGGGAAVFSYNTFNAVLTYGKTADSTIGSEIIGDAGSVRIGSVSQYLGISQRCGETEKEVFGYIPKIDLMMGEANSFADYIEGKNISDYTAKTVLAENVLICMEQIKESAEITYN